MRRRTLLVLVLLAGALTSQMSVAQINPRRCGISDGPGCNPNQCGVFDGPGCLAQAQLGVPESLLLTLGTRAATDVRKPDGQLNTLRDLFAALRACWAPPPTENAYRGMQMSMRFSLNRDGKLIGPPRITHASREVNQKTRDLYREAIERSLQDCTPLMFTRSFAGAIAGRPIVVRIIDNRDGAAQNRRREQSASCNPIALKPRGLRFS